jgi:hypothetical protein
LHDLLCHGTGFPAVVFIGVGEALILKPDSILALVSKRGS